MKWYNKFYKKYMKKILVVIILVASLLIPTAGVWAQVTGQNQGGVTGSNTGGVTGQNQPSVQTKLENPFKFKDVDSIPEFIKVIIDNIIIPIGAVIVTLAIIYSGFLFVTASGNEEKLRTAKRSFMYAVIGAVILLGAWVIAAAIKGTICQIAPDTPGLDCSRSGSSTSLPPPESDNGGPAFPTAF